MNTLMGTGIPAKPHEASSELWLWALTCLDKSTWATRMISYDITLISPPVVLAATALPRITSRLTKRIHMLHACYILHLWYFDVFGVFCIILGASVTFCHPPLGFCWEQRAFRLCTRQSSKLLFVFLRWGKRQPPCNKLRATKNAQVDALLVPTDPTDL